MSTADGQVGSSNQTCAALLRSDQGYLQYPEAEPLGPFLAHQAQPGVEGCEDTCHPATHHSKQDKCPNLRSRAHHTTPALSTACMLCSIQYVIFTDPLGWQQQRWQSCGHHGLALLLLNELEGIKHSNSLAHLIWHCPWSHMLTCQPPTWPYGAG